MNKSKLVHLLDDDYFIRDSLQFLLEPLGYTLECYSSGQTFLDSLKSIHIRCLLLDVRLPGLTGLEVQQYIRKNSKRFIPIIFMSGHGDEEVTAAALDNGAIGFLNKPFESKLLINYIEKAFNMST